MLIIDLDHEEYVVREAAERALLEIEDGDPAVLVEAYRSASPEARFRLKQVIEHWEKRRLAGRWELVEFQEKSETRPGDRNAVEVTVDGWASKTTKFTYRLNPLTQPKQIDWIVGTLTYRGIYKIEGNRLLLCNSDTPDQRRPTEFAGEEGDGFKLSIRERVETTPADAPE